MSVTIVVPVAWGEMDSYGHVNNAVYFRWFESGRMAYFHALGWPAIEKESGIGPILHSTEARFRVPLEYPDEVEITTRVTDVQADRFTMQYEIRSRKLGRIACAGNGLVVAYDYRALAKAALPEEIARRIAELEPPRVDS